MYNTKRIFNLLIVVTVLGGVASLTSSVTLNSISAHDKVKRGISTPRSSWKLELETSGGLTGRGVGNIRVNSDGRTHITTETGECQRKLVALRLKQVSRTVTRATPAKWRKAYLRADNPRGAADQIRYALRLTSGVGKESKVHQTYWFDETLENLPADLRALVEALNASRNELLDECSQ